MSRFFKAGCIAALAYASSLHAEEVLPLSNSQVTVDTMAELLSGPGVQISNPSYIIRTGGSNQSQAGQFSGYEFLLGDDFGQGVILSSGDVVDVLGPNSAADTETQFNTRSIEDSVFGGRVYDPVKFVFSVVPQEDVLVLDF
ncbi:MAG: choice-of-anchor L domain-containing protein, partial [Pseudomonadota bacterium]|nr:choice-of-anchor L domain-containing protein [Pseudomonadota bacterium]